MKILVIDDAKRNIASARLTLQGHDVTTADSIQQAYDILRGAATFDAVLTDLFLPLGSFRGSMNTQAYDRPSSDLPAGLVFAVKAANKGIRTVLCTDANHHTDWICAILDLLYGDEGPNKRIAYVESRQVCMEAVWDDAKQEIVPDEKWWEKNVPDLKDWLAAMQHSRLFPEIDAE